MVQSLKQATGKRLLLLARWSYKRLLPLAKRSYRQYGSGVSDGQLLSYWLMQKVLGFNRDVPWPVHFTSIVTAWDRIDIRNDQASPGAAPGCYINAGNGIKIGRNLTCGPHCVLASTNHVQNDYARAIASPPIIIGDNVWLGSHVTVTAGARIGWNVVIAAGSVVVGEVPSNCVAAGSPCHKVKDKDPYLGEPYRWIVNGRRLR